MDYAALEVELVGVLQGYFAANQMTDAFDARQMPENQNELLQTYEKGLVNVHYMDSDYDAPASTSIIMQMERPHVAIYLQVDGMKDVNKGGFRLLKAVKEALIGYKPANARTRMWISGYGDWQIHDGQLMPYIEFTFETVNQQVIVEDNENIGGPLVSVDSDLYSK